MTLSLNLCLSGQALTPALTIHKNFNTSFKAGQFFMHQYNSTKFTLAATEQAIQLDLLEPGKQGWITPQPKQSLIQKPLPKEKLTTDKLQKSLSIPHTVLQKCPMGKAILWDLYVVWHQGRDKWQIYKRTTK
ncbi:MAG: hypothetical protein ACOC04_02425 [Halothece sp.]